MRISIKDIFDETCTELLITAQLDSGARSLWPACCQRLLCCAPSVGTETCRGPKAGASVPPNALLQRAPSGLRHAQRNCFTKSCHVCAVRLVVDVVHNSGVKTRSLECRRRPWAAAGDI